MVFNLHRAFIIKSFTVDCSKIQNLVLLMYDDVRVKSKNRCVLEICLLNTD